MSAGGHDGRRIQGGRMINDKLTFESKQQKSDLIEAAPVVQICDLRLYRRQTLLLSISRTLRLPPPPRSGIVLLPSVHQLPAPGSPDPLRPTHLGESVSHEPREGAERLGRAARPPAARGSELLA